MKKLYLYLLVLLGMGLTAEAQTFGQDKDYVAVGIKGGVNLPRMYYFQNEALTQLPQEWTLTPMGGLFVEVPVGNSLIIAPEAVYVQRGTDVSYEHISGSNVHYAMNVSYADVRLPFEFRWRISPYFQPYLSLGAEAGMRLFGQIHIDRTAPIAMDETIDVGDANMGLLHASAFGGVGIRSKFPIGRRDLVVKLSVTCHQGLLDTYSKSEQEGSVPAVNVNAYQITGYRLPQGIEACLGVALPLHSRDDDACATFARDRSRRHSGGQMFGY